MARYTFFTSGSDAKSLWAWARQLVTALNIRDAQLGSVPVGMSATWRGTAAYAGGDWLLENGATYTSTAYPALFAVIGHTYGGAGTSFKVPNSGATTYIRAQ